MGRRVARQETLMVGLGEENGGMRRERAQDELKRKRKK